VAQATLFGNASTQKPPPLQPTQTQHKLIVGVTVGLAPVGVSDGVAVGVTVSVGVGLPVGVMLTVGVRVGDPVGVSVGVRLGVAVGRSAWPQPPTQVSAS
jgi:hypothetical protein